MNIILFGPPGVGKSTTIGILKTLGERAIDLEDIYPHKIRFQIPNLVNNAFLGAADLNPKRKYANSVKVLLALDQQTYDDRRAKRDSQNPAKANQDHHSMRDWIKGVHYDHILSAEDSNQLIKNLQQLANHYFKGGDSNDRSASKISSEPDSGRTK